MSGEDLAVIIVDRGMFEDHLPNNVLAALKRCQKEFGSGRRNKGQSLRCKGSYDIDMGALNGTKEGQSSDGVEDRRSSGAGEGQSSNGVGKDQRSSGAGEGQSSNGVGKDQRSSGAGEGQSSNGVGKDRRSSGAGEGQSSNGVGKDQRSSGAENGHSEKGQSSNGDHETVVIEADVHQISYI